MLQGIEVETLLEEELTTNDEEYVSSSEDDLQDERNEMADEELDEIMVTIFGNSDEEDDTQLSYKYSKAAYTHYTHNHTITPT